MNRLLLLAALALPRVAAAERGTFASQPVLSESYDIGSSAPVSDTPWWEAFNDPGLNAVMEEGLEGNLDLRGTWDRVRSARSITLNALSPVLPTVSLDSAISAAPKDTLGFNFGGLPGGGDQDGLYYNANATLNARLELDLFGKSIVAYQASVKDADASEADHAAAALALSSNLAAAWLDVVLQKSRLELLENQLETNQRVLEITEMRFDRADASAVDVLQQRQQVATSEAALPLARASYATAGQQLAVLMGRMPTNIPTEYFGAALPEPGPLPNLGRPEDLLANRPDLRAADARLTSSWQRRMSKERAFLPTFSANANAGFQLFDAGEFNSQFAWGIGGAISLPIFNGGRNISALRQARADEASASRTLGQATLVAAQEVTSAAVNYTEQIERLHAVRRQEEASRLAFEEATSRYAQGVEPYVTVLTSLVSYQSSQIEVLVAHRDVLSTRIQLHQALGGSWTDSLQPTDEGR